LPLFTYSSLSHPPLEIAGAFAADEHFVVGGGFEGELELVVKVT
jgi:hypothetical protein